MKQEAKIQKGPPVLLRVVSKKFSYAYDDHGKTHVREIEWKGNRVLHDGKEYGPGETFSVDSETANGLLAIGCVQLASDKEKTYRPPHIDHIIKPSHGVNFADQLAGKYPTRMGAGDRDSEWENDDED